MKHVKHKTLLAIGGLGLGVVLLSSCTANFCSPTDKAAMAYPYEQGVTVYVTKADYEALKTKEETKDIIAAEEALSATAATYGLPSVAGPAFVDESGTALNDAVYKYVPYTGKGDSVNFTANKATAFLNWFLGTASTNGFSLPSLYYYSLIDDFALKASTTTFLVRAQGENYNYVGKDDFKTKVVDNPTLKAKLGEIKVGYELTDEQINDPAAEYVAVNPYRQNDPTESDTRTEIPVDHSILRKYGNVKFSGYDAETGSPSSATWRCGITKPAATPNLASRP